jgi:hypothetical protein
MPKTKGKCASAILVAHADLAMSVTRSEGCFISGHFIAVVFFRDFRVFRGHFFSLSSGPSNRPEHGKFAGRQQRFPIYFCVDPALVAALLSRLHPSAS